MKLRDYQQDLKARLYKSWHAGNRNVLLVSPTGSGKTVVMASIALDIETRGTVIAHRAELVGQISIAMARMGVEHDIIASDSVVRFCIQQQIAEAGRSVYRQGARVTVASVDTIKARAGSLSQWFAQQQWWMTDEAHHLLPKNKWGAVVQMMTNAVGVGVTATPMRADRKGLDGIFHDMVVGPTPRELINRGMLCDYRIFAPTNSIDLTDVKIGSTGDYSQPGLRQAAHKSQIVGDVVSSYKQFAAGKRGITFTVDVEQAVELATVFNEADVPAMAVTGKTPDTVRADAIKRFRDGRLLQLVNVDLFGEGFDVPAVEVVSMARPTMSYGLYVQQFGRALRILDGKEHGIIIDHVGNVKRHGLPDAPRKWSLSVEKGGKRAVNDDKPIPVTTCNECFAAYERVHSACPFCGYKPEPDGRSRPEYVDGDLAELDAATLAAMRGEIEAMDAVEPDIPPTMNGDKYANQIRNVHRANQAAQYELRQAMDLWAGRWRDAGDDLSQRQRRFYLTFGVDVMTAQTLKRKDAEALLERIRNV